MDIMADHDIKVVLGTPTAAPPIWLAQKYPEILPLDERGRVKHEGTRRAVCFNNDTFWNASKRLVENMARALGDHPQLIAWQIDSGIGGHQTEWSFNEDSRLEWQNWLKLKYETVERLNDRLGLRYLGTGRFLVRPGADAHVRARRRTIRRCCWTGTAFAATPSLPSSACRPMCCTKFARTIPSPSTCARSAANSIISTWRTWWTSFPSKANAAIKAKSSELACDIDILRSLKKHEHPHARRRLRFLGD